MPAGGGAINRPKPPPHRTTPPKPPPATDTSVGGNTNAGKTIGPPTLANISTSNQIGGANNPSKTNAKGNVVPKATSSNAYKQNFTNSGDYTKGGTIKQGAANRLGLSAKGAPGGGGGGGGGRRTGPPGSYGGGGTTSGGGGGGFTRGGGGSTGVRPGGTQADQIPGRPPGASGYNITHNGNGFGTRPEGEVQLDFGSETGATGGGGGGGAAGSNPLAGGTSLSGLSVEDVTKFGAKETAKQRLKNKGVVKTRSY